MANILKALVEGSNSAGGYLVPTEFSRRLLALVQAKAVVMDDCDIRQMAGLTQYIPKVTSGTTARWVDEVGTITSSQPGFGRVTLTAKKVAALTEASSEVLEDNNVNVADHLIEQMGTDIALAIDNEMLNGTGGNFAGLRYTGSMTNAVDANGNPGMTHADGTDSTLTGATITVKAVQAAVTEVLKDNHEQPDVSYWNPKTIGQIQQLTDGSARPILNNETYGSPLLREGISWTLYGTKVKTTTQLPTNLTYGTAAAQSGSCADAIVARSKQFAFCGQRRGFIWKTDYDIETDKYQYQTTTRLAFAIKYADAYCAIRAITDS
ncbi:MAG: phage major capsid protein [Candidatus Helarchaeota archaeon]